jgi:hypothetical protein
LSGTVPSKETTGFKKKIYAGSLYSNPALSRDSLECTHRRLLSCHQFCQPTPPDLRIWENISAKQIEILQTTVRWGINTIQTSSSGRFFDAVASNLGLRRAINYEGQAAIELTRGLFLYWLRRAMDDRLSARDREYGPQGAEWGTTR